MLNSYFTPNSKQDSSTREGDGMLPKFKPLLSLAAQWTEPFRRRILRVMCICPQS